MFVSKRLSFIRFGKLPRAYHRTGRESQLSTNFRTSSLRSLDFEIYFLFIFSGLLNPAACCLKVGCYFESTGRNNEMSPANIQPIPTSLQSFCTQNGRGDFHRIFHSANISSYWQKSVLGFVLSNVPVIHRTQLAGQNFHRIPTRQIYINKGLTAKLALFRQIVESP